MQGGKPSKVDNARLAVIGLTSSNDRPLVPLFKALGFVQTDGKPADRWSQYRDRSKSKAVLAEGIKQAYPEFFSAHPDAQNRSNDVLKNVVKAKSDLGEAGADMVVRTSRPSWGLPTSAGLREPKTTQAMTPEALEAPAAAMVGAIARPIPKSRSTFSYSYPPTPMRTHTTSCSRRGPSTSSFEYRHDP